MLEQIDLTRTVYVFHNDATDRNQGVVLGEKGALLVDPGADPADLAAIDELLASLGVPVEAVAYTHNRGEGPAEDMWPGAVRLGTESPAGPEPWPSSLAGWEAVAFSGADEGLTGLYSAREGILFSGDMLAGGHLIPLLHAGSQACLDALNVVEGLDVKSLVPSRGTVAKGKRAIRQRLEHDRTYLRSLRVHVASSISSGRSLERAVEVARQLYEDYPHLDEHLINMARVWEELWDPDDAEAR